MIIIENRVLSSSCERIEGKKSLAIVYYLSRRKGFRSLLCDFLFAIENSETFF